MGQFNCQYKFLSHNRVEQFKYFQNRKVYPSNFIDINYDIVFSFWKRPFEKYFSRTRNDSLKINKGFLTWEFSENWSGQLLLKVHIFLDFISVLNSLSLHYFFQTFSQIGGVTAQASVRTTCCKCWARCWRRPLTHSNCHLFCSRARICPRREAMCVDN